MRDGGSPGEQTPNTGRLWPDPVAAIAILMRDAVEELVCKELRPFRDHTYQRKRWIRQ